MNTYWDLTERERAVLSREDVETFLDAELMTKGVLAVKAPTYLPVPEVVLNKNDLYEIDPQSSHGRPHLAFPNEDAARTFLGLGGIVIDADWQIGSDVKFAQPVPNDAPVRTIALATRESVEIARIKLREAKAATEENEKRKRVYEEQLRNVDKALGGLWEDWYACQEKAYRVGRVIETFEKYVKMAGSEATAAKFLAQVFTPPQIAEAEEWTDRAMSHHEAA